MIDSPMKDQTLKSLSIARDNLVKLAREQCGSNGNRETRVLLDLIDEFDAVHSKIESTFKPQPSPLESLRRNLLVKPEHQGDPNGYR